MTSKNKFGFEALETKSVTPKRDRNPGPMGTAVREAAESLSEATEAKVEQRRQNAADAKEYRLARDTGRVLVPLPLEDVFTDDLPRDRLDLNAVASSSEMDELKASISARGQKEPIEVYADEAGRYQLKKGWRRLTALSQLYSETGDEAFANVIARIAEPGEARIARYVDMVEENVVREDLSFAEMAQVAITAAHDADIAESDPEALVARLYGNLHKMKRSYIRTFVSLLQLLGDDLKWPKDISRNLGVDVMRALRAGDLDADALRGGLARCKSSEEQSVVLETFVKVARSAKSSSPRAPKEKYEFRLGDTKITARPGECRIVADVDFTDVPRERLEEAVRAFQSIIKRQ